MLSRLSGVSRFKICTHELGNGAITPTEHTRINEALRAEADRLRSLTAQIDFGRLESGLTGSPP
jgi:hypothetical protein